MAECKRGPKSKDRAATPIRGMPRPPAHLPPAAKLHWYEVAKLIDEAGYLSRLDRFALEQYCSLYATWLDARKKVDKEGPVVTLTNKCAQINPWQKVAVQCQRDMRSYLDRFGLTPAARAKIAAPDAEKVDAGWAEFDAG